MSSFSAAMYVAGSTLWAGAGAIAGTLGIGPGATGFVAGQAGMTGANLATGALAAKMGGNVAQVNMANAAGNSVASGGTGMAASKGGVMAMPTGPVSKGMEKGAAKIAGKVAMSAGGPSGPAVAAKGSLLGDVGRQALVTAGAGYATGMFTGEEDPLAYYGVNMNGKQPDFILPGQINPETGNPATEQDARAYNEWKQAGKGEPNPFAAMPVEQAPVAG